MLVVNTKKKRQVVVGSIFVVIINTPTKGNSEEKGLFQYKLQATVSP